MPTSAPEVGRLLCLDEEVIAAILGPACLVALGAERALLAVADDREAGGLQTLRDQVIHGGLGPALTKGEVVLDGSSLVAVPFDQHELARVRLEPARVFIEDLRGIGPDVVFVEVEEDVLDV